MNTMTTFPLIGNKIELPQWVVQVKQRPDLFFSVSPEEDLLLSACPWPVLKSGHLPKSWLDSDPGFPVLLRDFAPEVAANRSWIFLPNLPEHHFERIFHLRTQPKKPVVRTLVFLKVEQHYLRHEVETLYPNRDLRFIYTDRESSYVPKNEKEFKKELFCYQVHWLPDSIISLNFDATDTLTPSHLHALHLGAYLENGFSEEIVLPARSRSTWYGEWQLSIDGSTNLRKEN